MSHDLKIAYLLYDSELRGYLKRKVGNAHAAADLAQDAFAQVAELPASASLRNVRAYLFQVARNLLVDHLRQEGRRQTFPAPAEMLCDIADDTPSPEDVLIGRERVARLRQAVEELPPRTRAVFTLARLEGHSYAAVAEQLGISQSSVQKHLAAALRHLTERVGPP